MTDSTQSVNVCSHLHQLQTWKLLQHGEHVVFPKGLNGELEAHHFSFPELPPWDTTATDGSAGELLPIEVILGDTEHDSMLTIPPSSASLAPASHHNTLDGKSPYEALEDLPLPKQRMCLAWRRWTHLHMYLQPPPSRHPQATPPHGTLPSLHKSAIHCPQPPHPNPQEQLVPLLITSPKPWPGLAHPTYHKKWPSYKRK